MSKNHSGKLYKMFMDNPPGKEVSPGEWVNYPSFWICLYMSYKCTRRCPYCYTLTQKPDQLEMDDKTFDRLVEWIPEVYHDNDRKVNFVCFLGGEPLLRTDRIRKIMDNVYKETPGMMGGLFSNGDLYDKCNWDDLQDIQIWATNSSYTPVEELGRRLRIVKERGNTTSNTLTAVLDDLNMNRIEDLINCVYENGCRIRFYKDMFRAYDVEYMEKLKKSLHKICDMTEDYFNRGYHIVTSYVIDYTVPSWDLDQNAYICGKGILSVKPDGSIAPCIRNHSYIVGDIWTPNPSKLAKDKNFKMDYRRDDLPEECKICDIKGACQGGCPNDRFMTTGSFSGKHPMCEIYKEIIPRLRDLEMLKKEKKNNNPLECKTVNYLKNKGKEDIV